MSTEPRLGRDGKPLTPITAHWRFSNDGIQLSTGLWWAAYIAPSALQPGKWWWKTTACGANASDPAPSGYVDTPEQALAEARRILMMDHLYDYTLPDDSRAMEMLVTLKTFKKE